MMTKPLIALSAVIVSSAMMLSGCQTAKGWIAKRDNGSLDYQSSQKLAPLELPANQETAAFIPLYPTPSVGANTLELQNAAKKQYQLPKPERAVRLSSDSQ